MPDDFDAAQLIGLEYHGIMDVQQTCLVDARISP
jgi:hypothetical protein